MVVPRQVSGKDYTTEIYGVTRKSTQRKDEQHIFGSCMPRFTGKTQRYKGVPNSSPSIPSKCMYNMSDETPIVGKYNLTSENPFINNATSISSKGYGQFASREDRFSNNQTFIGSALQKSYGTPGPGTYTFPKKPDNNHKVDNLCFGSTKTKEPVPYTHLTPAPGQYEWEPQTLPRFTRVKTQQLPSNSRKNITHKPNLPSINK